VPGNLTVIPENLNVTGGDRADFKCCSNSNVSIRWRHEPTTGNNRFVCDGEEIRLENYAVDLSQPNCSILSILKTTYIETGKYTCNANENTQAVATLRLIEGIRSPKEQYEGVSLTTGALDTYLRSTKTNVPVTNGSTNNAVSGFKLSNEENVSEITPAWPTILSVMVPLVVLGTVIAIVVFFHFRKKRVPKTNSPEAIPLTVRRSENLETIQIEIPIERDNVIEEDYVKKRDNLMSLIAQCQDLDHTLTCTKNDLLDSKNDLLREATRVKDQFTAILEQAQTSHANLKSTIIGAQSEHENLKGTMARVKANENGLKDVVMQAQIEKINISSIVTDAEIKRRNLKVAESDRYNLERTAADAECMYKNLASAMTDAQKKNDCLTRTISNARKHQEKLSDTVRTAKCKEGNLVCTVASAHRIKKELQQVISDAESTISPSEPAFKYGNNNRSPKLSTPDVTEENEPVNASASVNLAIGKKSNCLSPRLSYSGVPSLITSDANKQGPRILEVGLPSDILSPTQLNIRPRDLNPNPNYVQVVDEMY